MQLTKALQAAQVEGEESLKTAAAQLEEGQNLIASAKEKLSSAAAQKQTAERLCGEAGKMKAETEGRMSVLSKETRQFVQE